MYTSAYVVILDFVDVDVVDIVLLGWLLHYTVYGNERFYYLRIPIFSFFLTRKKNQKK